MTKRLSVGLLVGALCLGAGCGSGESSPPHPDCGKDGFICNPSGLPFVQVAVAVSDLCGGLIAECDLARTPPPGATTAKLIQPGPGKVCLSGTVEVGGWTAMILPFSTFDPGLMKILATFNATRLGITQVDFTIDSPLTGGVTVGAATTPPAPVDCPNASCFTGFDLVTDPASGTKVTFTKPGPEVAPFANFEATGGDTFDPTALEHVAFAPTGSGDFAFCISDLKFLDAAGNEVKP